MTITFRTYSPILKRCFVDTKTVNTMADFRLYATALYSGNWEILAIEAA